MNVFPASILEQVTSAQPLAATVHRLASSISFGTSPGLDPEHLLTDLRLSEELEKEFREPFAALGYQLGAAERSDRFGLGRTKYSVARAGDTEVAILEIPPEIVTTYSKPCLSAFNTKLATFRGVICRLLSPKVDKLAGAYELALQDNLVDQGKFVAWVDILVFRNPETSFPFARVMALEPARSRNGGNGPRGVSEDDTRFMTEQLASASANAGPIAGKSYFRGIVSASDWPDKFKNSILDGWSGDINQDARSLVTYCLGKRYPSNHQRGGQLLIGPVLFTRLEDLDFPPPADSRIAEILIRSGWISEPDTLAKLATYVKR